jgi:type IV pilus assembly PilX-like protein
VRSRSSRGTILLLVLLCLAVLTVIGIALKFSTGFERASAANEWSISRAFYAADAGVRWAMAGLAAGPDAFLGRPEFAQPFGTVSFPMPGHDHGPAGPFSGDPTEEGIRVAVERPSFLGRRPWPAEWSAAGAGEFLYTFEVHARATEAFRARYSAELVADVEVGPLPADFLERTAPGGIIGGVHPTGNGVEPMDMKPPVRAVSMNWMEP